MSTTEDAAPAVPGCRPTGGTPVTLEADAIESTSDDALRALRADLDDAGYVPTELVVSVRFDADCSLATQAEADRVREHLRVADFLGAGTVRLAVDGVADPAKVRPAVAALRERAEREGLALVVDGADADRL